MSSHPLSMTSIPDPGFGDDRGVADPNVRRAMDSYRAGNLAMSELIALLRGSRVLVPVVAVLDELESDELGSDELESDELESQVPVRLAREKDSHMAAVSMINPDGRRGLLAFTGVDSLSHWDATARPVPIIFEAALNAAQAEGADALVLDVTTGLIAIPVDALK